MTIDKEKTPICENFLMYFFLLWQNLKWQKIFMWKYDFFAIYHWNSFWQCLYVFYLLSKNIFSNWYFCNLQFCHNGRNNFWRHRKKCNFVQRELDCVSKFVNMYHCELLPFTMYTKLKLLLSLRWKLKVGVKYIQGHVNVSRNKKELIESFPKYHLNIRNIFSLCILFSLSSSSLRKYVQIRFFFFNF